MEWLKDIWIGLWKYAILSPPPDYKLVQNLTASYGGGGGSVARSSSSLNYVHYLYGANILELTLTCYVRDLAKP